MAIFNYRIAFGPAANIIPKRGVGHNALYSTKRNTSFFLFDLTGTPDTWFIHTNHSDLCKALPYTFDSTSRSPNDKWLISQFLSAWFLRQRSISSQIRHKYFFRLRSLLLQQWSAIKSRLFSNSCKNRETKTYIRFSYKRTVFHLGFFLPCVQDTLICRIPCAFVMSNNRHKCHLHCRNYIVIPPPPLCPPEKDYTAFNPLQVSRRMNSR